MSRKTGEQLYLESLKGGANHPVIHSNRYELAWFELSPAEKRKWNRKAKETIQ